MAILAQCDQCGFRYTAPDALGGKKVRCKRCGAIFALPAGGSASEAEAKQWSESLEDLEASASALAAVSAAGTHGPSTNGPSSRLTAEDSIDAILAGAHSAEGVSVAEAIRDTQQFDFPYSREVDRFLPPGLVVVSLLLLIVQTFGSGDLEALGRAWVPVVRLVLIVGLYCLLIWPLAYLGLKKGVAVQKAHMPWSPLWKSFAAFTFPCALGYTMWLVGQSLPSLLLGCIAGLLVALAAVWLLFRVRLDRGVQPLMYSAVIFLLAVALAGLVIFGINHTTNAVALGSQSAHEFASSPILPGLAWDNTPPVLDEPLRDEPPVAPAPVATDTDAPPADPSAQEQPPETIDTTAATDPAPIRPTEDVPPTPPGPVAVIPDDTPTPPAPNLFDMTPRRPPPEAQPPERVDPAPPKPPVRGGLQADAIQASPFVRAVKPSGVEGGFDRVLYPLAGGEHLLVIRQEGDDDVIERWHIPTWKRTARHRARGDASGGEPYALSPDGSTLAMIMNWPTLSVQAWSFEDQRVAGVLELDRTLGQPELIGFVSPTHLIVHWQRDTVHGLEVWDLRTRRPVRIDLTGVDTLENNFALSPDGRTFAIAGRTAQGPAVALYALNTQRVQRLLPIRLLDAQWGVKPTGLAFSADGSALSALFEKEGNALISTWRLPAGRDVPPMLFPAGALTAAGEIHLGQQISWLAGTSYWLLHGADLVDATTGRVIGQTGFRDVLHQHMVGSTEAHLIHIDDSGQSQLVLVQFDESRLNAPER